MAGADRDAGRRERLGRLQQLATFACRADADDIDIDIDIDDMLAELHGGRMHVRARVSAGRADHVRSWARRDPGAVVRVGRTGWVSGLDDAYVCGAGNRHDLRALPTV